MNFFSAQNIHLYEQRLALGMTMGKFLLGVRFITKFIMLQKQLPPPKSSTGHSENRFGSTSQKLSRKLPLTLFVFTRRRAVACLRTTTEACSFKFEKSNEMQTFSNSNSSKCCSGNLKKIVSRTQAAVFPSNVEKWSFFWSRMLVCTNTDVIRSN